MMSGESVGSGLVGNSVEYHAPLAFKEQRLRTKLRYFFMNPCEKYSVKKKFPWKLVLQLLKIILVTVQLVMFGASRSKHVYFLEKSNLAFKHMYLKDWTPAYETMPYPPASGKYALYTIPDFYDHTNYALHRYNKTELLAIGTYHFDDVNDTKPAMVMCKTRYKKGTIFAYNQSYIFDSHKVTECFDLHGVEQWDNETGKVDYVYDTEAYLRQINQSLQFDRVIEVQLRFTLKTVHLKTLTKLYAPDCYRINITIIYDNSGHNGQMPVFLESEMEALKCEGSITYDSDSDKGIVSFYVAYDSLIIIISLFSLFLCIRSIYKAQRLRKETVGFFKATYYKDLSIHDKLEFINFWYVMIIINDVITIIGSALKIQIESQRSHHYEICGVLLGTGNLLVWFGVLRYLKFFETYNILILTMRKAFPNVLRFLVCAGVFYFGFTVCGWIVLGPYHIKFRTISASSECLFSLVNGDDMFVTFSVIKSEVNEKTGAPAYVWWFSRLYLYSFVSLFIYVVLNLFIAVILDTYEVIKFRTLSSASETLFSLLNGDDMFVTFQGVKDNRIGTYMWWYSRAYIYISVSFFTYIVLNLFIGVILDAYETIKHYYEHGFPQTELHEFIDKSPDDDLFSRSNDIHTACCTGNLCHNICDFINRCLMPTRRTRPNEGEDESVPYQVHNAETDALLKST